MTTLVPAGPYLPTTPTDSGGVLDHDVVHQAIADATAELQTATALHGALLGVKVWSTGSSAYVWSGDGSAPSAGAYTQILFIDPTGTHDPSTSTGGRSNANDLWETGVTGGGGAGALIASKVYNPGTVQTINVTGATFSDVDATNLAVTFIVPASGQVIVRQESAFVSAASTQLDWNLREGSSDVAASAAGVSYNGGQGRAGKSVLITGLTPGASKTWKWGHARTFGSTTVSTLYGGSWGQALMEVWAA